MPRSQSHQFSPRKLFPVRCYEGAWKGFFIFYPWDACQEVCKLQCMISPRNLSVFFIPRNNNVSLVNSSPQSSPGSALIQAMRPSKTGPIPYYCPKQGNRKVLLEIWLYNCLSDNSAFVPADTITDNVIYY